MKKYYLHNGLEQQGPFDKDELKVKGINKDTHIWQEGFADWTKAGNIDELKDLFVAPPPFTANKSTPPPIHKKEPVVVEQKRKTSWTLITVVVVISMIIFGGLVMISNNPNAIPGVKLEVNTPKPIVITSRYDDNNSTLFKEKGTVYTSVQNQGGDGNVLVVFHVYQAGNSYERTKSIYLSANESKDLNVTFDEVTRLGGDIKYEVQAKAE
jgi:hypothetical protein